MTRTGSWTLVAAAVGAFAAGQARAGGEAERPRHAIEVSPVSPLFHIYAVQYAYRLGWGDEVLGGLAYADMAAKAAASRQPRWMDVLITPNLRTADVGTNHSFTVFAGYRLHLWRGLHLEYQLWPAWNDFWSDRDRRYYSGFDLWNEFRLGWTFDFALAGRPFLLNLQYLAGFGLYQGNKPSNFRDGAERVFRAPVFFLGTRF